MDVRMLKDLQEVKSRPKLASREIRRKTHCGLHELDKLEGLLLGELRDPRFVVSLVAQKSSR